MSPTNMYSKTVSGQTVIFGYSPVIIDSTRTLPYMQYALLKNPSGSVLSPGAAGASLPVAVTNESSGPMFTVVFIPVLATNASITVSYADFMAMMKPTLKSINSGETLINLQWDNEDSDFSLWASPTGTVQLKAGEQYMVSTVPVAADTFNAIPAGMLYFSMEPTTTSTFDGTEFGILGVRYRLKLNPSVT